MNIVRRLMRRLFGNRSAGEVVRPVGVDDATQPEVLVESDEEEVVEVDSRGGIYRRGQAVRPRTVLRDPHGEYGGAAG